MIVRLYKESDYDDVLNIPRNGYDLDELFDHALEKIVVTDDEGEIITVGSLRTIVEVVAITDMGQSVRARREALIKLLEAMTFIAKQYGYDEMHCTAENEKWQDHLKEYGFRPTKFQALVTEV